MLKFDVFLPWPLAKTPGAHTPSAQASDEEDEKGATGLSLNSHGKSMLCNAGME